MSSLSRTDPYLYPVLTAREARVGIQGPGRAPRSWSGTWVPAARTPNGNVSLGIRDPGLKREGAGRPQRKAESAEKTKLRPRCPDGTVRRETVAARRRGAAGRRGAREATRGGENKGCTGAHSPRPQSAARSRLGDSWPRIP